MSNVTCIKTYRNKKMTAEQKLSKVQFFRWWRSRGYKMGVRLDAFQSRVPLNGVMYKVIGVRDSWDAPLVIKNHIGQIKHIGIDQLQRKFKWEA